MSKRKDKIIEVSIKLFNEKGCANISTVNIADELGISVGNLYYYFKNKEEIIIAIYNEFLELLSKQLTSFNPNIDMPFDFYAHLKYKMKVEEQYRFLRLEMNYLYTNFPIIKNELETSLIKTHNQIKNLFLHQIKYGYLIELDELELNFLCSNSWILNSQWEIFWILKKEENKIVKNHKGKLNFLLFLKRYLTEKMFNKSNFNETIIYIKKEIDDVL